LRRQIGVAGTLPLVAMVLTLASWLTLLGWLWRESPRSLAWTGIFYLAVALAELAFSKRRIIFREKQ
jgi:hypothetical protein